MTVTIRTRNLCIFLLGIILITLGSPQPTLAADNEPGKLIVRYFFLELTDEQQKILADATNKDVKSGDAILITTPDGKNILIDSGIPQTADDLVGRLQELGITKLDYAIASHAHSDHIGGFSAVLDNIEVETFFQSKVDYAESGYYRRLQGQIATKEINGKYLEDGDIVEISEDVTLEVLNPPAGLTPEIAGKLSTARVNDLSLVIRLTYQDFSMLFTGDIYREAERLLVNKYGSEKLRARVFDAPHHGQDTSSTFALLEAVMPEIVVISRDELASIDNYQRYRKVGAQVYVTAFHGEIQISTDGHDIEVAVDTEFSSPFLDQGF